MLDWRMKDRSEKFDILKKMDPVEEQGAEAQGWGQGARPQDPVLENGGEKHCQIVLIAKIEF